MSMRFVFAILDYYVARDATASALFGQNANGYQPGRRNTRQERPVTLAVGGGVDYDLESGRW
jgi:hypothetical protein